MGHCAGPGDGNIITSNFPALDSTFQATNFQSTFVELDIVYRFVIVQEVGGGGSPLEECVNLYYKCLTVGRPLPYHGPGGDLSR